MANDDKDDCMLVKDAFLENRVFNDLRFDRTMPEEDP